MKTSFFLILCSLFMIDAGAQENSFLLYSFKGNVSVIENKTETKAKVGKLLNANATIKVASGAMVTLICNEVAMFSIRKPGNYSLTQFGDSCRVSNSSFTANYVKYVWAQMTKSSAAPGSNRKLYMNTVGAVSRSVNNIWIDPRLDTVNYSGGDFPLSWKSYADAKEFEFSLYNQNNIATAAFKTTVSKLKIPIPKFATNLKPGNTYYWTAAVKGENNEELKVLNVVSKETYNELLQSLKSATGNFENAAEEAYRIAFMLEDAHYLSEAYQHYLKAATLAPDVPLYRSTLMSFKKDYEIK
ncbi:MAG TPA: hypothetical protein VFX58_18430 [Chitinophagaceae bacterium]|nr:hypothetical protein [Chitinophagaceae bacterium]